MAVRPAQASDIEAVCCVELASFTAPWSRESITEDMLHNKNARYMVVENGEKEIVGYGSAWVVFDEAQIMNIAVLPTQRRHGYGEELVEVLLSHMWKEAVHQVFLEVRRSNVSALSLYEKMGFITQGIRKNYYQNPVEDAYIMLLSKKEDE